MLILFHWLVKGYNQTMIGKRLAAEEASGKARGNARS